MKQYEGLYGDSTSLMRLSMDDAGTLTLANAYAPTQTQTYLYCGDGLFKHETGALELRFVQQNGRTYLTYRGYSAIPGLCDLVSETYYLEKSCRKTRSQTNYRPPGACARGQSLCFRDG